MYQTLFLSLLAITTTTNSFALAPQIKSFEIHEIPVTEEIQIMQEGPGIGEIIAMAEQVVAIGEKVYTLVQKGKPSIETNYAPISVVPRDPVTKEPIDPFDLEGDSDVVQRRFKGVIKDMFDNEVVTFDFLLQFTPKRSYEGKGNYILNAIIVPKVKATYGWDAAANMKVLSVSMKGKKDNRVAEAKLAVNYTAKFVGYNLDVTKLINIDGLGNIKID